MAESQIENIDDRKQIQQLKRIQWMKQPTGADPVADTWEPLRVGGGFGVDQKPWLLTSVAERPEGVVPVLASTALPIPFSPFPHYYSPLYLSVPLCRYTPKLFASISPAAAHNS